MSGINPRFGSGPITFDVAAAVTGGQLVIPDGTDNTKINVAGAAAANVIGVALSDAAPAGTDAATDVAARPTQVAVALEGAFNLTYAADAVFGDRLKAAASGQVEPMTLGSDADHLCIGTCLEAGGVTSGDKGLTWLDPFGI